MRLPSLLCAALAAGGAALPVVAAESDSDDAATSPPIPYSTVQVISSQDTVEVAR